MTTFSDHSINRILGIVQESPPATESSTSRRRHEYSGTALDRLKVVFSDNPYPDIHTREELSVELDIPEHKIQVWFQNRRTRKGCTKARRGPLRSKQHKTNDLKTPDYFSPYKGLTSYPYVFPTTNFMSAIPEYYPMMWTSPNLQHRPASNKRPDRLTELLLEELRSYETNNSTDEDST